MARKSPIMPWVKSTMAKGKRYYYFDTGKFDAAGKRIFTPLPPPSDKARFGEVYATLLGHRNRNAGGAQALTVKAMITLYYKHPNYLKLADGTKRLYTIYLNELERMMGHAPANDVRRDDIVLMIDRRADKPGAANMLLAITQALYKWARGRGHVSNNPCADIDRFIGGEHEPWPEWLLQEALAADDDRVRLCVNLLYYTAQRIGDVAQMQFGDIRDGTLTVTQQKTKKPLEIPVHKELKKAIDMTGRHLGPIIVGEHGKALVPNTLRRDIQAWAQARGQDIVPHGLRKNAVNALLEVGCSVTQTAAMSGQTLQLVEMYAKKRDQKKLAAQAVRRWEGTESDSSNR